MFMDSKGADLSKKRFVVFIDEIQQNFADGDQFSDRYTRTVTLSDGSVRAIELTPMMRHGKLVVELKDTGGHTYMGLEHAVSIMINGNLQVKVFDLDAGKTTAQLHSPILSRATSLISLPDFVPTGFTQGIEIFNDDRTPMGFVTSILCSCLGFGPEDAQQTMLDIHLRGGALLPTSSLAEAERLATEITAEAAKEGYPLLCRPVSVAT
jgi:ATP-dependent Clp protease adapter protein ClpS